MRIYLLPRSLANTDLLDCKNLINGGTTPQLEVLVVFHAIRWRSPSLNFKSQQEQLELLVVYSPAEKTAFYFIIIVALMI
jgi:hypothetical protein